MVIDILGVYLVDFASSRGGELKGRHYALVLTEKSRKDGTMLVAPITSKKRGNKYRGGFTIECKKYQQNPKYEKAFIKIRKIREIDKCRIIGHKIYDLDEIDQKKLIDVFNKVFLFLKDE